MTPRHQNAVELLPCELLSQRFGFQLLRHLFNPNDLPALLGSHLLLTEEHLLVEWQCIEAIRATATQMCADMIIVNKASFSGSPPTVKTSGYTLLSNLLPIS